MKTGVIGLGAMGAPMAVNFHRAGFLHRVWNRTRQKAENLAEQTGVIIADTPETLARECELVVISVSRDDDVRALVERIAGVVEAGTVVVDTSTVAAGTARRLADILAPHGAYFLDAPVSGGVEGAKQATLAMMVGGEAAVLERVAGTLGAIAANIVHIGATGSGQACKAVNQLMAAGINQAVSEALAFGEAMALNMDQVITIVASGAAGNWFLSHRGRSMLAGTYTPGFKLALHHKDLEICKTMLNEVDKASLPMLDETLRDYQTLIKEGHGDEDISALLRIKKDLLANKEK